MKVLEKDTGKFHLSADIGCHLFSTLPPFNIGNTVLGYGLGLASNSAVHPMFGKRTVTMMGDGGFWHNGLTSGIANTVFNKNDGILVIMKNGYSSATGTQELPSSPQHSETQAAGHEHGARARGHRRRLGEDRRQLPRRRGGEDAQGGDDHRLQGPQGHHRRGRVPARAPAQAAAAWSPKKLSKGERHVRVKYGVDEDTCTGDHSCIRLSGCPTLTIKDNPDPLRRDPVATVIDGCVGCGLCGENAHAAVLCPSFYRAEVIQNPTWWDKLVARIRGTPVH